MQSTGADGEGNEVIQQAKDLYQKVQNLLEFRRMNRDGFRKTLKKHDKVTQVPLMTTLMPEVDRRLPADQEQRLTEVLPPSGSASQPAS